ncbi:unnamed protein product [Rotaria sp. Silwood1]|nr:unnamed protein product [Rotaria sp. Silwood1]CAF1665410.1 unnamed protein product [Rotaria sp. Silwood1]CAF3818133.1 unnamed protein product [Rotaria sp. Silwood1]CAF3836982.1 unnamed protein product [Rotaria sp. Silwood1]
MYRAFPSSFLGSGLVYSCSSKCLTSEKYSVARVSSVGNTYLVFLLKNQLWQGGINFKPLLIISNCSLNNGIRALAKYKLRSTLG